MHSCGSRVACLAGALLMTVLTTGAHGQTDANLYKEALTREAALREDLAALQPGEPVEPLVQRIRVMVGAYEDIAQLFPASGYADNALWQGGVLAADVFVRFGDLTDRDAAQRLLNTLVAKFPASPLAAKVPSQIARVGKPPAAVSREVRREPASPPSGVVLLRGVRREVLPEVLRFTLDLDREAAFTDERIADAARVVVELLNTRAAATLAGVTRGAADTVVQQMRVDRSVDGRVRLVFELRETVRYSLYALYNPYRIVVDFERRPTRQTQAAPPVTPAPNAAGGFSLSRQLGLGATRIVIDPGHGGHDPGAQVSGLTEAALVLDVAIRLEQLLKSQEDVDVVLTRRTNAYVSLEDRTALANRSEADLFLSIHANANATAGVRGIETYVLNFATNPAAEALAARENAGSARSMRELPDLVEAIALNNKIDESRDLAAIVQSSLYQRLRPANRNLKNLGVKQAPFMVLVGATMPAILTEISFMTNSAEAALLKTEKYRQQIADGLFAGITRYQRGLKKARSAAASP
jgi:N-acetylmuramoyl-L-alanine amidase